MDLKAGMQDKIIDIKKILHELPKSELHVHLRGSIPIEIFTELLNKYSTKNILEKIPQEHKSMYEQYENIRPFMSPRHWEVDEVSELFRYKTFPQFLAAFRFTGCFIWDKNDLRKLIKGTLLKLKSQNIVYAEITISIIEYLRQGIPIQDIGSSLDELAESCGIKVKWIIDLVRDTGVFEALALLKKIIDLHCKNIVGITLGGSEHLFPPAQFKDVYAIAHEHGLRLTIHAGEALGPESIWDAVKILGAERIGHGVRAIEDEALLKYLIENNIPLEICPTSNIRTGIYPSYEYHPIRSLFEAGVPLTVNSDDPTFFNTSLIDEYTHLYNLGIHHTDIFKIIKNGFKYSFLPQEKIESYLSTLEEKWNNLIWKK